MKPVQTDRTNILPDADESGNRLACGEDGDHHILCRICEAYCGVTAKVRDSRIVKITPDRDNPHSLGQVCVKGTSFLDVVYDKDRITNPLRRNKETGEFSVVSWTDALDDIADRLAEIIRQGGYDAVANYLGNPNAFNSNSLTAIPSFLGHFGIWKKFSATPQDTHPRRLANYILYGSTALNPIPDLPRCDMLIVLGSNMLVSHGSLVTAPRIREDLDAIASRGRVVVVDPRCTETARRYEHLFVRPDGDAWLLAAMLNVVFEEKLVIEELLAERTFGWESLRDAVRPITPDYAAAFCGIPAQQIIELARSFATTRRAAIYGRVGTCRGRFSTLLNMFICGLNIVTGKFAVEGGWAFGDSPIDVVGPRPDKEAFSSSEQVYVSKALPCRNTRFGSQPYVEETLASGLLADEILTPGEGQVRALLIESGNPVLSVPDGDRLVEAIETLDLCVSIDIYINETNRLADYILPGTTFFERDDVPIFGLPHMVRPYFQVSQSVIHPVGEARVDSTILTDIAQRLDVLLNADAGCSAYANNEPPLFDPRATINGMLRTSGAHFPGGEVGDDAMTVEGVSRFAHGIMLAERLQCTNSWDKIFNADGRIHLWHESIGSEMDRLLATPPPPASELRLFGRRDLRSINSWMHNSEKLVRSQAPALIMHPKDAADRNIVDGQVVEITSDLASCEVPVKISEEVVAGSVCYPHGWGHNGGWQGANETVGININRLASDDDVEAISGASLLDGIIVSVRAKASDGSPASR